ncbi:MAG: DUF2188 domain-containing protein [Tannerella sp.]|jgi:hypothetical protein|nr:DUF2188 domain-containing protein [Tannerella sp.]
MENYYQVIYRNENRWVVKRTGAKRAAKGFATRRAAISYGKKMMNKAKSKLFVHNRYGMVDDMYDYAYQ